MEFCNKVAGLAAITPILPYSNALRLTFIHNPMKHLPYF